jgi:hypothetical protein
MADTRSLLRRISWTWKRDFVAVVLVLTVLVGLWLHAFFPSAKHIDFCGQRITFAKNCQRYLRIVGEKHYGGSKCVIIVDEPHYDLGGQWNLYKGLQVFFADNPHLLEDCVFLAEGVEKGEELSVEPLVAIAPDPPDKTVGAVLGSYLIPGYVAFEWEVQSGVAIVGIETHSLYESSANLWMDEGDLEVWLLTVNARNRHMAEALKSFAESNKTAFIFLGGRHLAGLNQRTYESAMRKFSSVGSSEVAEQLKASENRGVIDYLRQWKIDYLYLAPLSGAPSGDDSASKKYRALFKAQRSGTYDVYIDTVVRELIADRPMSQDAAGVTVCPSPQAAAQFLVVYNAAVEGKGDNKGQEEGKKKPKDGKSFWNKLKNWGRGIKTNGESGKKRRYYQWDRTHGDLEGYDRYGRHIGSYNPETGVQTKPPVKGRVIDI